MLIRGTIVFAGQPEPWQSRETVREVDRSAELVRLIHAGLQEADVEGDGVSTSAIERLLSHPVGPDSVDQWPVLRAAMTELCGGRVTSKRVGYGLRPYGLSDEFASHHSLDFICSESQNSVSKSSAASWD